MSSDTTLVIEENKTWGENTQIEKIVEILAGNSNNPTLEEIDKMLGHESRQE